MRLVVRTLPALTLAGLLACAQPRPFEPLVAETEIGRIDRSDELAGKSVSSSTAGAWQHRTTGSPPPGRGEKLVRTTSVTGTAGRVSSKTKSKDGLAADAARYYGAEFDAEIETASSGTGDDGTVVGISGGARGAYGGPAGAVPRDAREPSDPAASPAPLEDSEGGDVRARVERRFDRALAPGKAVARKRRPADGTSALPAQQLKAGATDDNADYQAFLEFLGTWIERKDIRDLYYPMDVSERRFLRVVDANGDPVPGAVVSVVDEAADRIVFSGRTYGDGRVAFYPLLEPLAMSGGEGPPELLIEAYIPRPDGTPTGVRTHWDGTGAEFELQLDEPVALDDPLQLDVCFLIDTTGSMSDEIRSIKASLLQVTEKLRGLEREFDLRYGAVLYRDIGDDYLTARHPFTADIEAFDEALKAVKAGGGGDGPESLNQGLAEAVDGIDWRPGAAKVMFLIADAPPHMDYAGDLPYGESAKAAVAKGIRIHAVAASGLTPVGTLVFRQIAQFTRGKFIFIEYGSTAKTAESHGVAGKVKSNNLEDILFEQISDELAHFGRGD